MHRGLPMHIPVSEYGSEEFQIAPAVLACTGSFCRANALVPGGGSARARTPKGYHEKYVHTGCTCILPVAGTRVSLSVKIKKLGRWRTRTPVGIPTPGTSGTTTSTTSTRVHAGALRSYSVSGVHTRGTTGHASRSRFAVLALHIGGGAPVPGYPEFKEATPAATVVVVLLVCIVCPYPDTHTEPVHTGYPGTGTGGMPRTRNVGTRVPRVPGYP
eukprot:2407636-Rhodomonas_salina.1